MTEWVSSPDQFGLREVKYPVAFFTTKSGAERVIEKMDADGWYMIHHAGSIAAFQDKTPVVPFGNGITGRRHIVVLPVGEGKTVAFTAHVDKSLATLHEMDKRKTPKLLQAFKAVYAPVAKRTPNPEADVAPASILLDLHSYPPDTKSPYQPFDLVLLRVKGVTDDRFLHELYQLLQSRQFHVGVIDTPKKRADLIYTAKRASPGTQVVLLEVNEKYGDRLERVAQDIAGALREAGEGPYVENPGPVIMAMLGGVTAGITGTLLGAALAHYLHGGNTRRKNEAADAESEMYRTFHAFKPRSEINALLADPEPPITVLGPLNHIVYWCSKWQRPNVRYIHTWKKSHLIVGRDKAGAYWLNGKARIRGEGITDHPGPAKWKDDAEWTIDIPKRVVYLGICEEINADGEIITLKRTMLCTDAEGERLYLVPLKSGQRPSHPSGYHE